MGCFFKLVNPSYLHSKILLFSLQTKQVILSLFPFCMECMTVLQILRLSVQLGFGLTKRIESKNIRCLILSFKARGDSFLHGFGKGLESIITVFLPFTVVVLQFRDICA